MERKIKSEAIKTKEIKIVTVTNIIKRNLTLAQKVLQNI